MYVQPLLLTSLLGRPNISAGMPAGAARAEGVNGPGRSSQGRRANPPRLDPSRPIERISENDDGDALLISKEADSALARQVGDPKAGREGDPKEEVAANKEGGNKEEVDGKPAVQLDEESQRYVAKLAARDRDVRTHEQAHLAAAGPFATGGPSFEFTTGPDGKRYAIGGEVGIDTGPIAGDPEATIRKAQVIRAAAMAPANPSGQDQNVAAAAMKMETQARQELRQSNPQTASQLAAGETQNGNLSVSRVATRPGSLFNAYA